MEPLERWHYIGLIESVVLYCQRPHDDEYFACGTLQRRSKSDPMVGAN